MNKWVAFFLGFILGQSVYFIGYMTAPLPTTPPMWYSLHVNGRATEIGCMIAGSNGWCQDEHTIVVYENDIVSVKPMRITDLVVKTQ